MSEAQPLDAIATFAPWAADEERALRRRLHNAQTIASARAARARSDAGRMLFWLAASEASAWTFARCSQDDLKDVADALVRTFQAARTFERLAGGPQ